MINPIDDTRTGRTSPALVPGLVLGIAFLGTGVLASSATAQCDGGEVTIEELLAQDNQGYEQFGYSVSVSGNVAIVGANEDDDLGMSSGSAYVFRFDGSSWSQEQKLLAQDGGPGDMFGIAVAIDDDVAVVGMPRDDDMGSNAGAVYVFRFNGSSWQQEQKLLAEDGSAWDSFGTSVGVADGTILVGAYDDDAGYNAGSVYRFVDNGGSWSWEGKLFASDPGSSDFFGSALDMVDGLAIVGAYGAGWEVGAAYVFRLDGDTWNEEQKLVASDAENYDNFGRTVSIAGDLAVVGAQNEGNSNTGIFDGQGAAYVYRFGSAGWTEEAKLMDPDGGPQDKFGASAAVSSDRVVVGAPLDDDGGNQSGSVFVFRHDGLSWVVDGQIVAPGDGIDQFGHAVGRFGNQAVVGALSGSAFMVVGGGGAAGTPVPGDANGDGFTNVDDLVHVLENWGPCTGEDQCSGDLDCDEMVGVDDLVIVITYWDDPEN